MLELPRDQPITGLRFSADGLTIAVMAISGFPEGAANFMRFDARTGRRLAGPVRVNRRGYSPLMITRDGRRMVVVGYDGITVRDAATLAVLERLPGAGVSGSLSASPLRFQTVSAPYALSSDDRTLAIGDTDGSLRLLDLETGEVRTASGRHAAAVSDARFTPDGRSVITTGDDGDIIVWDVRRAAAGERLSGHAGFVFSPMISRDGATLYTASLDGTVFIWDLAGSRRLGRPLASRRRGRGRGGDGAERGRRRDRSRAARRRGRSRRRRLAAGAPDRSGPAGRASSPGSASCPAAISSWSAARPAGWRCSTPIRAA